MSFVVFAFSSFSWGFFQRASERTNNSHFSLSFSLFFFPFKKKLLNSLVKKIRAAGVNVLLVQKSILRDATTDLALHYLAKAKILVVRDVERDDIEIISKSLGLRPVAHVDHLREDKLGRARLVEDVALPGGGGGRVVRVLGVANPGRTACALLRGSNALVLDEVSCFFCFLLVLLSLSLSLSLISSHVSHLLSLF